MNTLTELFNHYGYIVLYVALTLELIALPTPGETLMTYCGFLVFQGKLNWSLSIIIAAAGVITGITISYFIGKTLGHSFFEKYGIRIHLGPDKLEKASAWFGKYGNRLLFVAYFIPGIRHITGYFSGVTKIPYKNFALNAYLGALLWTGTFISLGKVLGPDWEKFHETIKKYLIIGSVIMGVLLIGVHLYRNYKKRILVSLEKSLTKSFLVFHTLGKMRMAILGAAVAFIGLSVLVVGLIQDFLAQEFNQFDEIVSFLINLCFSQALLPIMVLFKFFLGYPMLAAAVILAMSWILFKGKNRLLEVCFLLLIVLGGEMLEESLRLLFHRIGPLGLALSGHTRYTFPSEQSFMATAVYGFAAFMVLRHMKKPWQGTLAIIFAFVLCVFTGLSPLVFHLQYPSDVFAGYVFGGIWLSLNIILLELYRILPEIKH
ncbi:MAG: membrane-associated protein [Peptococcaceae bacterium]|nr:membrane-associated protein [Peptococcaceae bacterium]